MTVRLARAFPAFLLLSTAVSVADGPAATDPTTVRLERAEEAFRERRCDEALGLWRGLAESGDPQAQGLLGTVLVTGECGRPEDPEEGPRWLRAAAASGDPLGTANLAGLLLRGEGIEADPVEAARLYHVAAAAGLPAAQYALAAMYFEGRGVERDPARAADFAAQAAAAGHPAGCFLLGRMVLRGEGVEADDAEAHRLFLVAARAGHARAQSFLAMQYALGRGVERDPVEAWAWYDIADRNGAPGAAERRDEIEETLSRKERRRARDRAATFSAYLAPEYRPLGER